MTDEQLQKEKEMLGKVLVCIAVALIAPGLLFSYPLLKLGILRPINQQKAKVAEMANFFLATIVAAVLLWLSAIATVIYLAVN